jgi:hypothetical protein
MANQFKTSRKTELVALRAAESAAYLTVGSRKYFKDQLKGKRNGKTFEFVITDAGEYQRGIDISGNGASDLVERKIEKTLNVGNVAVATNLIEKVTDLNWDKEVAIPQGKKLINGVVRDAIDGIKGKTVDGVTVTDYNGDFGDTNVCFAGIGYGPLTAASNYLASISDEAQYAFINPMINNKLSNTGDAFKPVDADPMFSKGLLGRIGQTEYRTCQFQPLVSVSSALATAMATVDSITYADNGDKTATITLKASGSAIAVKIPKGFTIWINGLYATDLVGDRTSELKAFVAVADGANNGEMIVKSFTAEELIGQGTKVMCKADGSALGASKTAAETALAGMVTGVGDVKFLAAGNYFAGQVRLDGAYEFEMLDEIDASNADTERADNEGIVVFQNRAVDVLKGSNVTRWSSIVMAGIVEPRAVATVLVSDADTNKVHLV